MYFCRLYLSPECKRGRRLHSEIDDNETKQNIKSQRIEIIYSSMTTNQQTTSLKDIEAIVK